MVSELFVLFIVMKFKMFLRYNVDIYAFNFPIFWFFCECLISEQLSETEGIFYLILGEFTILFLKIFFSFISEIIFPTI